MKISPDPRKIPPAKWQNGCWGDQGDGTYRNPVIAGDYSDPDVIRVGADYFLATSTFANSPGVGILHSLDLVNWTSIGAAIPDITVLGPEFNWDRMNRYGVGVYAPTIRFHNGMFFVFVNCYSGEGFFVCTAKDPAGEWEVHQILDREGRPLRTRCWTDPCPFWDSDGRAYLAASRPGKMWFSYLFEMTPDGRQLLDADVTHMNQDETIYEYPLGGTRFSPHFSSEGNKIYLRNGFYYLIHIEFLDGGLGTGTYVFRSRNLFGIKADGTPGRPGDIGEYEIYKIGDVDPEPGGQHLPGQGSLVDTGDGRWYWIAQFNHLTTDGRTPHLLPVTWVDDWPVIGVDVAGLHGKFSSRLEKPIAGAGRAFPFGSDDFASPRLAKFWQWNHQPRAEKWSLRDRPGYLRLHAFPPLESGRFATVGNVLNQRHFRSRETRCVVLLDPAGVVAGQEAGLARFNGGESSARVGIRHDGRNLQFVYREEGRRSLQVNGPQISPDATRIWIESMVSEEEKNQFSFSFDGERFTPFGEIYSLSPGGYRGDMVGIYTFHDSAETGHVDIASFEYSVKNTPES